MLSICTCGHCFMYLYSIYICTRVKWSLYLCTLYYTLYICPSKNCFCTYNLQTYMHMSKLFSVFLHTLHFMSEICKLYTSMNSEHIPLYTVYSEHMYRVNCRVYTLQCSYNLWQSILLYRSTHKYYLTSTYAHYTLYSVLYTVHCTMSTEHCTLYTVHCNLYNIMCAL